MKLIRIMTNHDDDDAQEENDTPEEADYNDYGETMISLMVNGS